MTCISLRNASHWLHANNKHSSASGEWHHNPKTGGVVGYSLIHGLQFILVSTKSECGNHKNTSYTVFPWQMWNLWNLHAPIAFSICLLTCHHMCFYLCVCVSHSPSPPQPPPPHTHSQVRNFCYSGQCCSNTGNKVLNSASSACPVQSQLLVCLQTLFNWRLL